jgi:hypothetical protein
MTTLNETDFDRFVAEARDEVDPREMFPGATRNMLIVSKINRHFGKPEAKDVEDDGN